MKILCILPVLKKDEPIEGLSAQEVVNKLGKVGIFLRRQNLYPILRDLESLEYISPNGQHGLEGYYSRRRSKIYYLTEKGELYRNELLDIGLVPDEENPVKKNKISSKRGTRERTVQSSQALANLLSVTQHTKK